MECLFEDGENEVASPTLQQFSLIDNTLTSMSALFLSLRLSSFSFLGCWLGWKQELTSRFFFKRNENQSIHQFQHFQLGQYGNLHCR